MTDDCRRELAGPVTAKFILEKPMLPRPAFYVSTSVTGLGVLWTDDRNHAKQFSSQESAEAMRGELGRDVVVTSVEGKTNG